MAKISLLNISTYTRFLRPLYRICQQATDIEVLSMLELPHGLNCRPRPCEGVAGAMSASPVVCKVVQFTVKQRQLHVSPPANELSRLLEPKFLATPTIGSSQSRVEVNISRQRRFEVKTQPGQCKTATPVLWIVFSDRYRVSIMYMIHNNGFLLPI